ncbi:hypothetical protein [Rhizobium laguerreae]|uniref:hypothetical protein n=1 Tax=Rhizobium laguerreae TaxID=1076926 RepID=UPI001C909E50|nr:hypothetical protein [Rhizobium laguerreae]MBY3212130.1 hypothetical protein [Rhizobium laguerreae]
MQGPQIPLFAFAAQTSGGAQTPYAEDSLSVDANGEGTVSGLDYVMPAHSKGSVKANLAVAALTSQQAQNIDALFKSLLSGSAREKFESFENLHGTGNLNFFRFLFAGIEADYNKTRHLLKSSGLTDDNIKELVTMISDTVKKMSTVSLDLYIDNAGNDYSASGEIKVYTIEGKISSDKNVVEYRVLANKGTAGANGATAPTNVKVIPLD